MVSLSIAVAAPSAAVLLAGFRDGITHVSPFQWAMRDQPSRYRYFSAVTDHTLRVTIRCIVSRTLRLRHRLYVLEASLKSVVVVWIRRSAGV